MFRIFMYSMNKLYTNRRSRICSSQDFHQNSCNEFKHLSASSMYKNIIIKFKRELQEFQLSKIKVKTRVKVWLLNEIDYEISLGRTLKFCYRKKLHPYQVSGFWPFQPLNGKFVYLKVQNIKIIFECPSDHQSQCFLQFVHI